MGHTTRRMTLPLRRLPLLVLPLLGAGLAACLTSAQSTTTADGGRTHDGGTVKTSPDTGSQPRPDAGTRIDTGTPGTDATKAHDAATIRPDAGRDAPAPVDATVPVDAIAPVDGTAGSRCTMTTTEISCTQQTYTITTPAGSDPEAGTTYPSYERVVHYQVPLGTPPAAGWPVVIMYQGAFVSAGLTFSATSSELYGMYYQTELVMNLLDAGYAVLAPEALSNGNTYWETNIAPYAADWSGSADDVLVRMMLAGIKAGSSVRSTRARSTRPASRAAAT